MHDAVSRAHAANAVANIHFPARAVLLENYRKAQLDAAWARETLAAAEARCLAFQNQLQALDSTICTAQRRLAPVLSLPHDIACEIFRLWAESERTDTTVEPAAFVAAEVCRIWRDVALASPTAWAYIKLDFQRLKDRPQSHGAVLHSVRLQLQRSANAPLYIHLINYDSVFARMRSSYGAPFAAIAEQAARWRSFFMSGDVSPTEDSFGADFLGFFFGMRTPLLEHFTLNKCGMDPSLLEEIDFLPVASRLRTLSICPDVIGSYALNIPELPRLQVLEINSGAVDERQDLSFVSLWNVLKQWPHIRELRILGTRELNSFSDEDLPTEPLLLPNLETIQIDATMETLDYIAPMLRLPTLEAVDFSTPVEGDRFRCELFTHHGRAIRRLRLSGGSYLRNLSGFPNLEELSLRNVKLEAAFFQRLTPENAEYPCRKLRVVHTEQCRFFTPIVGPALVRFVDERTHHAAKNKVARLENVTISCAEELEPIRIAGSYANVEGIPAWVHDHVQRYFAGYNN